MDVYSSGRNEALTLLANPAGHTLGGTLWTLRSSIMTSPVLYAPVFNHVKEKHLDGAVLPPKPGATVIVGAERSKETAVKSVNRNRKLLGE
jgi:cleavage and polyadenylation specificity factor subunit 2